MQLSLLSEHKNKKGENAMSEKALAEFKKAQDDLREKRSVAIAKKAVEMLLNSICLTEYEAIDLAIQMQGDTSPFAREFVEKVKEVYPGIL